MNNVGIKKINGGFADMLDNHIVNKISTIGKALTADVLLSRNIQEIPKLTDPIFQKVGLVAVAGSSDTGKSTFLRQLCIAIATNQETFLGFPIQAKHNSAIYLSTEDDEYAISYLLNKYNKVAKFQNDDYSGLRFLFESSNIIQELETQLNFQPADIVVIDAFTDLYSGRLNEANQVRSFLNEFSQLANKYECLFVFLHHTGKRTEREAPSKHNLLGSQAFEAKMRLVIELREDKFDATKRHLCIVKGNYLPKEMKSQSFELCFDENMIFTNTGERVEYSQLITAVERQDKIQRAKELKEEGLSNVEIAKMNGVDKSTIGRWLKDEK